MAQIDLPPVEANPPALRDGERLVVERVCQFLEAAIDARGARVERPCSADRPASRGAIVLSEAERDRLTRFFRVLHEWQCAVTAVATLTSERFDNEGPCGNDDALMDEDR